MIQVIQDHLGTVSFQKTLMSTFTWLLHNPGARYPCIVSFNISVSWSVHFYTSLFSHVWSPIVQVASESKIIMQFLLLCKIWPFYPSTWIPCPSVMNPGNRLHPLTSAYDRLQPLNPLYGWLSQCVKEALQLGDMQAHKSNIILS